jgi:hypothetical protein
MNQSDISELFNEILYRNPTNEEIELHSCKIKINREELL